MAVELRGRGKRGVASGLVRADLCIGQSNPPLLVGCGGVVHSLQGGKEGLRLGGVKVDSLMMVSSGFELSSE